MNWFIYALKQPSTLEVRYIGLTSDPRRRFRQHLNETLRGRELHKNRWIISLLTTGLEPVMEILESGTGRDSGADAERRWIASYRTSGADLVNITEGGDGVLGLSAEQIAERAAKSRAGWNRRTPEARAVTAERHRASTQKWQAAKTPEERRLSAIKREAVIGPERKRLAGIKGKALFTAQELTDIAKKRQQALTHEQRSAACKKGNAKLTPEQRSARSRIAALALNAKLTPEQIAASTLRAREARWGKRRQA